MDEDEMNDLADMYEAVAEESLIRELGSNPAMDDKDFDLFLNELLDEIVKELSDEEE